MISLTPSQLEIADMILASPLKRQSLAGLAGTGKTTILKYLYDEFKKAGTHVIVMAPTAKAASVLRSKGVPATTIHSIIYYFRGQFIDQKGREQLIFEDNEKDGVADMFFVDETSMVTDRQRADIESREIKTLWSGDPGQLPPVMSPPNGLLTKPTYLLREIHRQAADSPIIKWAYELRKGTPLAKPFPGISHIECLGRGPSFIATQMLDRNIDKMVVKTNAQRVALNFAMRTLLGKKGIVDDGDEIICTQNNKKLGVINGEVFRVLEVQKSHTLWSQVTLESQDDGRRRYVKLWNDQFGRERKTEDDVEKSYMLADYAYAITCHKMQGSSARHVGIAAKGYCGGDDRPWNYTAATRAEDQVTVFC